MSIYHDILGVPVTATPEETRLAYKRLAMKHHPDRGGGNDDFNRVQRAYRILSRKVCNECNGAGYVDKRNGAFVTQVECPRCWKGI